MPSKEIRTLTLKWQIPPEKIHQTKKSNDYLGHTFGHEGPDSLLSFLIKKGLAFALSAGASNRLQHAMAMFSISIELTEKGEQNYMEVIEYVYQFINKIKEEGPQDYVYEE